MGDGLQWLFKEAGGYIIEGGPIFKRLTVVLSKCGSCFGSEIRTEI